MRIYFCYSTKKTLLLSIYLFKLKLEFITNKIYGVTEMKQKEELGHYSKIREIDNLLYFNF